MTLRELRLLINSVGSSYDDMTLYDGDPSLGAPMLDIKLELGNNIDGNFLKLSTRIIAESGRYTKMFTDIGAIANEIRFNRKIGAIKAIREQLRDDAGKPMSLRDSKNYIDRYLPMGYQEIPDFDVNAAADKFISDHTVEWLDEDEFNL